MVGGKQVDDLALFVRDLARMLVYSLASRGDARWYLDGDETQGLWLLQDRIEGAGLLRVHHELTFADRRAAVLRRLLVDVDTGQFATAGDRDAGERSRLLVASYPSHWSSPEVTDGSGALLSPCTRHEMLPDLAAAAVGLLGLGAGDGDDLDSHRPPEVQLLTGCAARVIDRASYAFAQSRGLQEITDAQVEHERARESAVGACLRWIERMWDQLADGLGDQVGAVLGDLRRIGMVALPLEVIEGRHRLTVDFGPAPLRRVHQRRTGVLGLGARVRTFHLTRDIEVPVPDMAPALDSSMVVRAPDGLEFAPCLLVRTSRRRRPLAPSPASPDGELAPAPPRRLLAIQRDEILEMLGDMQSWVDHVLLEDCPRILELPAGVPVPDACLRPLDYLRRHRVQVAAERKRIRSLSLDTPQAHTDLRAAYDVAQDLLEAARPLGFRATFFADHAPETDVYATRLSAPIQVDSSRQLDLRFYARLRPSRRTYSWSLGALIASAVLTCTISLYLLRHTGVAGARVVDTRADSLVTLLVLVPASLLGAVLSTTTSGLARHVLRYWLNAVATFALLVPIGLALLIATMRQVPPFVLCGVMLSEGAGLLVAGRAWSVRRVLTGHLPRRRATAWVMWKVFRFPHPLAIVDQALRGRWDRR